MIFCYDVSFPHLVQIKSVWLGNGSDLASAPKYYIAHQMAIQNDTEKNCLSKMYIRLLKCINYTEKKNFEFTVKNGSCFAGILP